MPERLLRYEAHREARVVERLNRFLVSFEADGVEDLAHLHDPGRLKEIIYPGNRILLRKATNPSRKTAWDVVAGMTPGGWVLVNSALHRALAEKIFTSSLFPYRVSKIVPEVPHGKSRLDFLLEVNGKKVWVEVKGCTLAENGVALFPDAPTARGAKHMEELAEIARSGDSAMVLVLVFRQDAASFSPNARTDPKFAKSFLKALESGVEVLPLLLSYDGQWISLLKRIELRL